MTGMIIALSAPIAGGRGFVQIGNTGWSVAGPDLPAGVLVKITGRTGRVLWVEPFRRARDPLADRLRGRRLGPGNVALPASDPES